MGGIAYNLVQLYFIHNDLSIMAQVHCSFGDLSVCRLNVRILWRLGDRRPFCNFTLNPDEFKANNKMQHF